MALRTIFFCGHQSRYGLAHLKPVLEEFNVLAIVIATNERWGIFRNKISGESYNTIGKFLQFKRTIITHTNKMRSFTENVFSPNRSSSLESICSKRHIPLLPIFDINEDAFIENMKHYGPDLILSAAYPQIFSKKLLSIPERGVINFHPSLLPRCRGAHPHFWSIATGDKFGGISAHYMTENIDDGDVIAQIKFQIDYFYYEELYQKIINETPFLIKQVRLFYENVDRKPISQDSKNATYYKNDREIHRRIFWNIMSSQTIHNLIRTEQAFCFFRGRRIGIKHANIIKENRNMTNNVKAENGTIVDINENSVVVAVTNNYLAIHTLSARGKDISFDRWVSWKRVCIGEKFS
jgi:methionyl-tRNA formyltransferase